MVGSTAAYAMVMRGVGREVVLVDKNQKRSKAEAEDITHAVPFAHPLLVKSGNYSDLKGSRLVILCAGVSQARGESRLDLLRRNAAIFKEVVPDVLKKVPEAILVIATNPVDVMTHLSARYAADFDVSPSRVIGTGTTLDTARFRTLLGARVGVDAQHVHGYVIGEHGDSEVLAWSQVRIGASALERFCNRHDICFKEAEREEVDRNVRNAAYTIIEGKGATYYGIGSALAKIADVIIHDQRSILTVSTPTTEIAGMTDVSISLPRLVGGDGVLASFPLPLAQDEEEALQKSAAVVGKAIKELGE